MRRAAPISRDEILSRLSVDCESGRCYWIDATKHHARLNGIEAGSARPSSGGKSYWVIKIDGVARKRSQIVFAVANGRWSDKQVVHKNSNSLDDRIGNLIEKAHHGASPRHSINQGDRFGLLTAISEAGRSADNHRLWLCSCDCGGQKVFKSNNLKIARNPSCGCASLAPSILASTKHGKHRTPAYESWQSAMQRCENPSAKDYSNYGGRGIRMCPEWRESFQAFYDHMGERPHGMTLDRFPDTNGNYEPGNCRWATPSEQARNRRSSVYVQWRGETQHLAVVASDLGITYGAAFNRHKRGKLHDCSL